YDRRAFLLCMSRGGVHVGAFRQESYALWWKGDIAHFSGELAVEETARGRAVIWRNARIHLEPEMESERGEMAALVTEALKVHGLYGYTQTIAEVQIEPRGGRL